MSETPRHLFVYGTLMRKGRSPYAQLLRRRARFVGEGWTYGRLYNLGRFPGAVFDKDCTRTVHGEVFHLGSPALLVALDAYEGCDSQGTKCDLFYREAIEVRLLSGERFIAWAYPFAGATNGRPLVASGRFSLY